MSPDVDAIETRVRVLIADDSAEFRDGLRAMLDAVADMHVVGEAGTGDDAVRLAARLQPDVVLMDLRMPGCNGVQATEAVATSSPHMSVLVLTMFDGDESVLAAMRAGARGYILKGAPKVEILRSIRAAANGEGIFSPAIARRLSGLFSAKGVARVFTELTDREQEVLTLMSDGRSNGEIARQLSITLKTVQNHVSNICVKLGVADRTQAVLRVHEIQTNDF